MGTESSKLSDSDSDTMDSYMDRDGGYVVNRHRRSATCTEIDLGISTQRTLNVSASVNRCLFFSHDCTYGIIINDDVVIA